MESHRASEKWGQDYDHELVSKPSSATRSRKKIAVIVATSCLSFNNLNTWLKLIVLPETETVIYSSLENM